MNGISFLVLVSAYLTFCAAFLLGLNGWVAAQNARVQSALNVSGQRISCALDADLRASGLVIFKSARLESLVACADGNGGRFAWRPEVLRIAS